ncbi:MAG: hypothetical protein JW993_02850 [Sedimentisphaerales bacterium]|nr:hypothetical protein [Sedimentisphaerales bacterium]
MSDFEIDLHEDKTSYTPGETLRGAVRWNSQTSPRRLDLSLLWYTSGKGTRDVGVIETIGIDNPGALGSQEFAFTLPDGPYSFSGTLISLVWAVELTCTPGAETVRREIAVSPTGREIVLDHVPSQRRLPWTDKGPGGNPLESILSVRR